MTEVKSKTGNEEITSQGFLVELANLERRSVTNLLNAEAMDVPTDNQCKESTHNYELAKAWREVLLF